MTTKVFVGGLLAVFTLCFGLTANAIGVLSPTDAIIAIDLDPPSSNSNFPGGEPPSAAVDGDAFTKYLNFGGPGSGIIVTPFFNSGSIADGLQLTTGNDAEGRDPTSYQLFGTNDPIVSADNSDGLGGETYTLISAGPLTLPPGRNEAGPVVPFANTDEYLSYKLVFPTNKGDGLFQISEIELFGDVPAFSITDTELFSDGDATLAIQLGPDSRFPGLEGPGNLLDGDSNTKYLNFGKQNSGFIVTPNSGASVVENFRITTANDFPERDPTSFEIYGTNDTVVSLENGQGDGESWTLIDSGSIALPTDRFADGQIIDLDNTESYTSYRVVFPTLRDNSGMFPADSMQISGFEFNAVPEPASAVSLAMLVMGGLVVRTSRQK